MQKNTSEPMITEMYEKCIRCYWVTEEGSRWCLLKVLLEELSHKQTLEMYSINKWSGFSQAERTKKIWKKEISAHRCQNKREHVFRDSKSVSETGAACELGQMMGLQTQGWRTLCSEPRSLHISLKAIENQAKILRREWCG